MKLKVPFLFTVLVLSPLSGSPAVAQNSRQLTTTLLPVRQSGAVDEPGAVKGLLWVQNNPEKAIFLQFDLSGLPPGLKEGDINQTTLRLVAQNVVYQPAGNPNTGGSPVIVKGQLAKPDFSGVEDTKAVLSLSTLDQGNKVALQAPEDLRKAVYQKYSGDKKISLRLFTDTEKAGSLFYSTTTSGDSSSNLPRLVIKYTVGTPALLETLSWPQYQQNPEHTGRNPWTPFSAPTGFALEKIDLPKTSGGPGTIADYPLIYRGDIYLVNKVSELNYLVALDFKGTELWRKDIGKGVVQRSPVISRNGIFYTVTENQIAAYDLNRSGQPVGSYPLSQKLSDYTEITAANDGSIFVALQENSSNYIYGFTADLKPILKSGPFGTSMQRISTVTASPDGQKIFAETPNGAVIIDVADPTQAQRVQLKQPLDYYHAPIAGPAGGIMLFTDFTGSANKGNIWANTATREVWSSSGTLTPQPVLGSNDRVYYIQGGALQGHKYNQIGSAEITAGMGLNATSNLVLDGANNIYFWDNGDLYGLDADGKPLFEKQNFTTGPEKRDAKAPPPERFIRLMLGPDGSLWANNKSGNALYVFKPHYKDSITLRQEDIKTQTAYRAASTLEAGGVTVKDGTAVLFEAQKSIGFSRGFAVQKGASLLARTGF